MNLFSIVIFVLIFGAMVFFHELGHFIMAKLAGIKVEEFGFGFPPPRLWAIRRGETEYSINLIPLGGFVRMLGEEDPTDPRSFARAQKRWRIGVLTAGPLMNILLAVVIFSVTFMSGWPTTTASEVAIVGITRGSPAEAAGLREGDIIKGLAGYNIDGSEQLLQVTQANLGRSVPIEIIRGESELSLPVTPRTVWPEKQGPIGIGILDRPSEMELVTYPLGEALRQGSVRTVQIIAITFTIPVLLLRGQIPLAIARPVGPVGIFQITTQAAGIAVDTGMWYPILTVAATLSAAIGLANLLPIPGLDGGRLIFVLLEAIRRKKIAPQKEGLIHLVGMAFLISLVLLISYFDFLHPVSLSWGF